MRLENEDISWKLSRVLLHLIQENNTHPHPSGHRCAHHNNPEWALEMETWSQLETMRQLLCQRPPDPVLPDEILADIDAVIKNYNGHNLLTSSTSIAPNAIIKPTSKDSHKSINLSVWKGDITALTDVTAIVNAANSQLLGCFLPDHRCIDNIIHAAAGPRLRDACHAIMLNQDHLEPVGSVKVTPGFDLPASYVLHTVGPQLKGRQKPTALHEKQLANCYTSCLDGAEALPPLPDGRKVVVFCCISTGLFAFPSDVAARIALQTVVEWCFAHPTTTVTDIIFDTFLEKDWVLYRENMRSLHQTSGITVSEMNPPTKLLDPVLTPAVMQAREWLRNADYLIITAGAGLSAAIGLDYTSRDLFERHFPAFQALGLNRLYDVFGFQGWKDERQKWGYYFLHLNMVRNWPSSALYTRLLKLAERFGSQSFVRTSNADGLFVANGFSADRVSTPQGQYRFLQCLAKCRPDAVFLSEPFVDAALPFIDPITQCLTEESKIPRCMHCSGELTLCVRGGKYFNARPFREQEKKYEEFPLGVVLELGVGLNTPGVLRWPNEELLEKSTSRSFRLIRAGIGASACAPWDLEEQGLAVGLAGDLNAVVHALLG
ncbi:putative ganglioside induced differentiation associated protein [Aspergillus steynii IBT 23096]|uniref:Putative ganglioside induced differentiation associated protein n=1 Tax=Aspergillus steynii IBT 23096 TaxID=1392250 RepID=A0A2I2GMH1_9EURO|nr:putative ganglioside induced differentiation associated protein [Aspergillus steynii IBT 23096]PLB54076.1 putative ganglioside induced differentiation associated protein [Aspergillus steynii IBT 23096]